MFKKLSMLVALLLPLAFAACGGDDNDGGGGGSSTNTITVDVSSLDFDGYAGSKTFTISTDHEWATSVSDDWVTLSPKNGSAGTATVTVTVQKNGEFDPRTTTITIMSGSARKYITISQEGGDGVPDPNAIVCPIDGYKLVWNDEFNEGTTPDLNKWSYQIANSGWVNNELQNYVAGVTPDGTRTADIRNGSLRIRCLKENGKIYSARMYGNVRTGWTYGYIEAKIKLPKGKGTWPAFWMMPVNDTAWPDDGEMDIMEEVGASPNRVSSSLHALGHYHANNTQVTAERYLAGAEDEYHVYGMEWTSQYIQTYVDGEKLLYYANDGSGKRNWPYNTPFYVILNLAWGGSWGGWNGVDEGALPCMMEVDYVRVFQKK